jgi:hypothetical protein
MRKKVGRNEPCPCGSGIKYKRCCFKKSDSMLPISETELDISPHHFQLKGKQAEESIVEMAKNTFLVDWCYMNPRLPDGKEICDLLIIYDNIAIIWQVKDLKLNDDGRYNTSEINKNIRQLSGARRRLFEVPKPIELENPRRGKELFNHNNIDEVYLISALFGEGEDSFSLVEHIGSYTVHVFTRQFTELVLNELNTISDFIDYLRDKEAFITKNVELAIMGGEEELLAFYLLNDKSLKRLEEPNWALL